MDWREAEKEYTDEVIARTTIPKAFERAASRYEDGVAQKYKGGVYDRTLAGAAIDPAPDGKYADLTYDEMRHVVRRLAGGFRNLGVSDGERVAIYAETRMEWIQCDFAAQTAGGVVTTVYPTSSEQQVQYLLADPDASIVVAQNAELVKNILTVEGTLSLDSIVVLDDPGEYGDRDHVYTLADLYRMGQDVYSTQALEEWLDTRDAGDLSTIVYTSGTTGRPKGVKLSHWNIHAQMNAFRKRTAPRSDRDESVPTIDEDSRLLSFLPAAHIIARNTNNFGLVSGATIAYAESPDTLKEDIALVRPTGFAAVPRVYEKLYSAVREQAEESALKRRMFNWASEVARQYQETTDPGTVLEYKHSLAEKLVFDKVHEALGGRIELLVSGGGTLSTDLAKSYHAMGLPILEGYGLTETAPVVAFNPPEAPKVGTLGPPLYGVDVKVDSSVIPESEFQTTGDTGELLVKGPNVFEGYWEMPEKTEEVFEEDAEGIWFRTGDIVTIRSDDYLVFHERHKQILVTSTGKNVPPAPIEDSFAASDVVEQCMVVGDDEKFVAALIVPAFDAIRTWAEREGLELSADDEALCQDDRVHQRIQRAVAEVNEDFEPHEQIKQFRLVPEEWTEDNDLLTPTQKKKRHDIMDRYEYLLEEIYAEDEQPTREQAAEPDDD